MSREERIGLNEALFREVNERIGELSGGMDVPTLEIVCECGQLDCTARFELEHHAYEEMRSDPVLFAVVPGHEIPDVEEVVELRDQYAIVRKDPGEPSEVARETDPRS